MFVVYKELWIIYIEIISFGRSGGERSLSKRLLSPAFGFMTFSRRAAGDYSK
jgi:hypothetical protein